VLFSRSSDTTKSTRRVRPDKRRVKAALLALGIGTFVACAAAELVLRCAVYHPELSLAGLGARLRQPQYFSAGENEDDYWKLQYMFLDAEHKGPASQPDANLGWTACIADPRTCEHVDESKLRGRTPILLYGDSFAQCNTPEDECFPAILERSDLAKQYRMLDFGVGGYGFDQTYLLLARSINRYAALDPIVIVSLLTESDLDRSTLSFRCWPKPRLDIVDDRLRSRGGPLITDPDEWLKQNPLGFASFLWRFLQYKHIPLVGGLQRLVRGESRHAAEARELNRKILIEIEHELASRHLRHFILLFHIEPAALQRLEMFDWQEPLVRDVSRELGIDLVDTRAFFSAAAAMLHCDASRFYGHSGVLNGHLNVLGNRVAFEAMRRGLEKKFAGVDLERLEACVANEK